MRIDLLLIKIHKDIKNIMDDIALRQPLNEIIMNNDIINKMNDYINKYLNINKIIIY